MTIILTAIVITLLTTIGDYSINDYWWLVITTIGGYFINDSWWLLY
jgi:hypothetical protein